MIFWHAYALFTGGGLYHDNEAGPNVTMGSGQTVTRMRLTVCPGPIVTRPHCHEERLASLKANLFNKLSHDCLINATIVSDRCHARI